MEKTYENRFYGVFEAESTDHLPLVEQQDLFFAQLGDVDGSGIVKAADFGVLSTIIFLLRTLEIARKHNQQKAAAEPRSRSKPIPIMQRIEILAARCLEIVEGKAQSDGSPYPADALTLLSIKLGASMELANWQSLIKDGLKEMGVSEAREAKIRAKNAAIATAKDRAKEIAKKLWAADKSEKLRIKDVALSVWNQLIDDGFIDSLPNDRSGIHRWITPVAPAYASKPGKPKKA